MKVSIELNGAKVEIEDDKCSAYSGEFYFNRCKEYLTLATDELIKIIKESKK